MGISLPEPSADFSKNRLLRIIILAINAITLILGLVLMLGAAFLAIRTDAAGQILGFSALLGCAFFVVSAIGICGVTRYDALLFVYFVVTLFIAVVALFLTVYVIVKREAIEAELDASIQENWAARYADLGTDVQDQITKIFENSFEDGTFIDCEDIDTETQPYLASVCCDSPTAETCSTTWVNTCINVEILEDDCYAEIKSLYSENIGIVAGCVAALVVIACIPLGLVVKIMGFHEIVKHSQLITTICLAVVSVCICIAGGMFAGYLAHAGITSIAPLGYVVLIFGVFLLITTIITLVGLTKGNKILQLVSTICFGVLALVFLLLFIFCFAFQARALEYMETDCEANTECTVSPSYCWMTVEVDENTEACPTSILETCPTLEQCVEYIYFQTQLETSAALAEDTANCQELVSEFEAAAEENVNAFLQDVSDDECISLIRTADAANAFFGDNYQAWTGSVISYMDTAGYACAFTFLFCVVQVGASYYVTKTDSELQ
jgi:hypothetical protein